MPQKRSKNVIAFFVILHVLALLGFLCWQFFTWAGLCTFVGLTLITGLGVTIGYHRLLTHKGFQTFSFIRYGFALAGFYAGEGPPTLWVAYHRKHHQYSDQDEDPHSPRHGLFHAHMGWMTIFQSKLTLGRLVSRYAPDLSGDKFFEFLHKRYVLLHVALPVILILIGFIAGGWELATSLFIYGFLLRMVWVLHNTWSVNSVGHRWGYRNYDTDDDSRNHDH